MNRSLWRLAWISPVVAIFALVLFSTTMVSAKNSFLVAPGRVDFDLSRPNTQSFILTNNGDGPIRLAVEPVYFDVDSRSLAAGTPLNPDAAGKDDLRDFIRVSPRVVSLKPGQRRDIRISVRPPGTLPQGDYRAHLLVRMMETAMTLSTDTPVADEKTISMQLNLKMEIAVAVYGHKGKRDGRVEVRCGLTDTGTVSFEVTNRTSWRYDGWVRLYATGAPEDAEPLFEVPFTSLRETRRTVSTRWLPPGGGMDLRWQASTTRGAAGQGTCNPAGSGAATGVLPDSDPTDAVQPSTGG